MLVLMLGACTGTATEAPLPDAQSLLKKSAAEVKSAKSIKIKLELSGAPSFVDPDNRVSFVSANGAYVAPDRVSATVTAKILSIPGQVDVIAIGDDQWMRNQLLTAGRWAKAVFSPGFNAAKLVNSDEGIEKALNSLKEVKVIGREDVFGTKMYHLTATADGADISALTVGLIRGKVVNVDIYIAIDTGRVDHVIMVQPDTVTEKEPKPTTWTLELFDYDGNAKIEAPVIPTEQATSEATAEATSAQ
jgi:hypothetical protein